MRGIPPSPPQGPPRTVDEEVDEEEVARGLHPRLLDELRALQQRFDGIAQSQQAIDNMVRDIHQCVTTKISDSTSLPSTSLKGSSRRSPRNRAAWSPWTSTAAAELASKESGLSQVLLTERAPSSTASFRQSLSHSSPALGDRCLSDVVPDRGASTVMPLRNSQTQLGPAGERMSDQAKTNSVDLSLGCGSDAYNAVTTEAMPSRVPRGSIQITSAHASSTLAQSEATMKLMRSDTSHTKASMMTRGSSIPSTPGKHRGRRASYESGVSGVSTRTSVAVDQVRGAKKNKEELWAEMFAVRLAGVPPAEQYKLLSLTRSQSSQDTDLGEGCWTPLRTFLEGDQSLKVLKMLTLVSLFFVPLEYALLPSCSEHHEKVTETVLQLLHFVSSTVYILIVAAKFKVIGVSFRRDWPCLVAEGMAFVGVCVELFHVLGRWWGLYRWPDEVYLLHLFKVWRAFVRIEMHTWRVLPLLLELVLWFMYMGHLAACMAIRMARWERNNGLTSWADDLDYGLRDSKEPTCADFYSAALYFSGYTMTGVGYGDIHPANSQERLLTVFYMVLSQLFAAKIFADVTWITETIRQQKAQYYTLLSQTSAWLGSMRVPSSLQRRVRAYQDFAERQRERGAEECLRTLSRPLQEELMLVVYYDLVSKAPFLQEQPTAVVRAIIMSLKECFYLPCDVIVRKGDSGSELFFLRNGTASVFTSSELPSWKDAQLLDLKCGSYFGEVALLTGMRRRSWVIAKTFCSCSILTKQFMDQLFLDHPACLPGMVHSFQRTLGLECKTTWKEFASRLSAEFLSEADLFQWLCSGMDGETPAGLITWRRWELLAQRLQIQNLDAKLLWIKLSPNKHGHTEFDKLMYAIGESPEARPTTACITFGEDDDMARGEGDPAQTGTTESGAIILFQQSGMENEPSSGDLIATPTVLGAFSPQDSVTSALDNVAVPAQEAAAWRVSL